MADTSEPKTVPISEKDRIWLKRYCWHRGIGRKDAEFIEAMCSRILPFIKRPDEGHTRFEERVETRMDEEGVTDPFSDLRVAASLVVAGLNSLERLRPWLLAQIRSRLSHGTQAEDIAQQVLFRCFNDPVCYWQPISNAPSTEEVRKRRMSKILQNLIIDIYRKKHLFEISLNTPIPGEGTVLGDLIAAPEEDLYANTYNQWLFAAFETVLSEMRNEPKRFGFTTKHVNVVDLYFVQGLNYMEIRERTKVSLGTISTVIKRARQTLKSRIFV